MSENVSQVWHITHPEGQCNSVFHVDDIHSEKPTYFQQRMSAVSHRDSRQMPSVQMRRGNEKNIELHWLGPADSTLDRAGAGENAKEIRTLIIIYIRYFRLMVYYNLNLVGT